MVSDSADKLTQLYNDLLLLLDQETELWQKNDRLVERARSITDPRQEFNRWLQSKEGQAWKQKQFERQNSRCAACSEPLRFQDTVVHHVQPIKDLGSSANIPDNFRLLHPNCNLKIGTKVVDI